MTARADDMRQWWLLAAALSAVLVGLVGYIVTHPKGAKASVAAADGGVDGGAPWSEVVTAPRPDAGEYFSLYLMGSKVGYLFSRSWLVGDRFISVSEQSMQVKAEDGMRLVYEKVTHVYDAHPRGRLLTFVVEQRGDSAESTLEATCTPTGVRVLRKRPGEPNETQTIGPAREVVEDADQVRVALQRNQPVSGTLLSSDLEQYSVTTTPEDWATRRIGERDVKVRRVTTRASKMNADVTAFVDEQGRVLEMHFGPTMTALASDEARAKRHVPGADAGIETVAQLALPKAFGPDARRVPGQASFVVKGLPSSYQVDNYRQSFQRRADGAVAVTVHASKPARVQPLPVDDPGRGLNLKVTPELDANNPDLVAQARRLIEGQRDAYAAARAVVRWVKKTMKAEDTAAVRASDLLVDPRGDCTEHAMLAVALMRAGGIPARMVGGLVELPDAKSGRPVFQWHEWVEAYVGEWTQLDPMLGEEVASAAHFQLDTQGGSSVTPLIGALTVLEVR